MSATSTKQTLWGLQRITGRWMPLQSSDSVESLKEYERYFAQTTLDSYYSQVPFSGFANDSRPAYERFMVAKKAPKQ